MVEELDRETITLFIYRNLVNMNNPITVSSSTVLASELRIFNEENIHLPGSHLCQDSLLLVREVAESTVSYFRANKDFGYRWYFYRDRENLNDNKLR